MGNSHSSEQVNLEDFKEQVFSQVVFFISKYANHQLEFQPASQCTPDYLPSLKTQDYQAITNYYQGGSGDLDYHIENYLNEHVLNSQENVTRFHKILMAKLSQDPEDLVEEDMSDDNLDLASVASNVQQFIKSYEEAPVLPSNRSQSPSIRSLKSTRSLKSVQPKPSASNTSTNLKSSVEIDTKSHATAKTNKSLVSASTNKLQTRTEASNYSGEFTQPYEIPESEYLADAGASEHSEAPAQVSEQLQAETQAQVSEQLQAETQALEYPVENLVPEIQAEHMSEEELSECLVSRI